MHISSDQSEIMLKVVYIGPEGSGKTANLRHLHATAPEGSVSEIESLSAATDPSAQLEYLTVRLGTIGGKRVILQLWTTPGRKTHADTRRLILSDVDGVVFVADSRRSRLLANTASMRELHDNLINHFGRSPRNLPTVLQFNKRDCDNVVGIAELNGHLNIHGAPLFEVQADKGNGVLSSFRSLNEQMLAKLRFLKLISDEDDSDQNTPHTSRISKRMTGRTTVVVPSVDLALPRSTTRVQACAISPPAALANQDDAYEPVNEDLRIVCENGRRVLKKNRRSEALEPITPSAQFECGPVGREMRDMLAQLPPMATIAGLVIVALITVLWSTLWII
ncbi:MAG: GTP-binding protein [Planctomycetota bacterium]